MTRKRGPKSTGFSLLGRLRGGEHGANQLGANSLAEIFALGSLAGENAADFAKSHDNQKVDSKETAAEKARLESIMGESSDQTANLTHSLQETTWNKVGIIRTGKGLMEALDKINEIRAESKDARAADVRGLMRPLELDNLLLAGEMVTRAALTRTERRGAHFREDYPTEDDKWLANLSITNKTVK